MYIYNYIDNDIYIIILVADIQSKPSRRSRQGSLRCRTTNPRDCSSRFGHEAQQRTEDGEHLEKALWSANTRKMFFGANTQKMNK